MSIITCLEVGLKFMDDYNGALMLLATIILVGVTWYYAVQAKKQVDESHEMVIQSRNQEKAEAQKNINTTLNYAFLLNSEMQMNSVHLVIFQLYLRQGKIKQFLIKDHLIKGKLLSDSVWNATNIEVVKYFSKELMEALVGFYIGLQQLQKIIDSSSYQANTVNYINLTKTQLLSYLVCIRLLEKEIGLELRKQLTYDVEGKCVKIDSETGEVVPV